MGNDSGAIGSRIRDQREKLGISQDELSKRLGYKSRSSINKIELGERNLTQAKIKSIADALGTTPEYIMGWAEQKSPPERVDTIARRLALAMEKSGKRQTDIAKETGIDKGALSRYLKGTYEPKQDAIYKLASALDVSEMWLMGYDFPERQKSFKYDDIINSSEENARIFDFVGKALSTQDGFKALVLLSLSQMTEEEWKSFEAVWKRFCKHE